MTSPAYPRRPPFFAGKFCRLMTKVALANQLGTDVVCLLMVIAHQEDAAGYRGAVTWWNDQLKPLIGVKTDNALIRTRNKAIEAGWLHYTAGGKGIAGRYWVTVPRQFETLDSGQVSDRDGELGGGSLSPATGQPEFVIAPATGQPAISPVAGDRITEGQLKGNRRGSDNHSSLTQEEDSDASHLSGSAPPPAPAAPTPVAPPPAAKKPRKEPTGSHADARRAFCTRWLAKYGGEYRFVFGKHGKMLADMLKHLGGSVEKLTEVFNRFFADDDAYFAAGSRHELESLNRHFNRWLVAGPLPTARPPPGHRPATKAEALDDYFAAQAASALEGLDGGSP